MGNQPKPKWKDSTSYSQGQRGKIDPTAWELKIGNVRVWIAVGHIYHPDNWVMDCNNIGLRELPIAPNTASHKEAKKIALLQVMLRATARASELHELAADIFAIVEQD